MAEATGITPRTIRYYEEIGLLPSPAGRQAGRHRLYDEDSVERIRELVRLKELLGLRTSPNAMRLAARPPTFLRKVCRSPTRSTTTPTRAGRFCRKRAKPTPPSSPLAAASTWTRARN
ncbi:MAG TPA: MerR family transcriptional regulator [Solirubrobacterales bacterium]|nr:MerR family transcriptional regulator [Solirubrobacterales bacterium]